MQNTYNAQTAKFIAVIIQNMPNFSSENMQFWIDRPGEVRGLLAQALMMDHQYKPAVWKKVKIGVYKNLDVLRKTWNKFKVGRRAKDIVGNPAFTLAQTEEDIDLCVATVKELTGKDQATTKEVFDVIKRIGDLCPAEVGPALREQYLDQPNGEWLRVAMEPIKDSDDDLRVLLVDRDGDDLWLHAHCADPGDVWGGDFRFVFRARK